MPPYLILLGILAAAKKVQRLALELGSTLSSAAAGYSWGRTRSSRRERPR